MEKDLEFLKGKIIAHRGMHDIKKEIPENSTIAFKKAVESSYAIELDLQILKDNTVVVFHDNNSKRLTGINLELKDARYEEIKDLKLQNTKYRIPKLIEVLEIVDGKVPLIIELKTKNINFKLEKETLKILQNYSGKYVIKSFNPFTLMWLKKHYPNVIRGQLSCDFSKEKMNNIKRTILKNMLFNIFTKPDFVSYGIDSLPNKRVENYRGKKMVFGWTIKTKEQLDKAKKYCDSYICENIEEINRKRRN